MTNVKFVKATGLPFKRITSSLVKPLSILWSKRVKPHLDKSNCVKEARLVKSFVGNVFNLIFELKFNVFKLLSGLNRVSFKYSSLLFDKSSDCKFLKLENRFTGNELNSFEFKLRIFKVFRLSNVRESMEQNFNDERIIELISCSVDSSRNNERKTLRLRAFIFLKFTIGSRPSF